jgi:hypothetical protein
MDLHINPQNWHYIALPYDCNVDEIAFSNGEPAQLGTDYIIGWYDGEYRAANKKGAWKEIAPGSTLKKGLGYIVSIPGSGLVKRELRFPMSNEVIAEEKDETKTVGELHAWGGDDEDLRPNHKGWNMIGNPYLYTFKTTDIIGTDPSATPLATGKLTKEDVTPWNGKYVIDGKTSNLRYIVAPVDNGWSEYEQTRIGTMAPFTSYFVQIGGDDPSVSQGVAFNYSRVAHNSMPRRAPALTEDNHPVWYGVELVAPNGEKDNTTVLISNDFTDGYDMMDDLVKMRGDYYKYYQKPVLASRNNEGEMAFNALPDESAAAGIPLNYYAYNNGSYTIATDNHFDLEEVKSAMLYDATTNQYYDLLTDNHSFNLTKGDNTKRFKLFVTVERKSPQIATDVDNVLEDGQLSLIAIDKMLVLSGLTNDADVYVYDISGKLLTGDRANGNIGVWRTKVPATGVYFVRVNSVHGQQTLRTVVQ